MEYTDTVAAAAAESAVTASTGDCGAGSSGGCCGVYGGASWPASPLGRPSSAGKTMWKILIAGAAALMPARHVQASRLRTPVLSEVLGFSDRAGPRTARDHLPRADARGNHGGSKYDDSLLEGLLDTLWRLSAAVPSRPPRLKSVEPGDARTFLDAMEGYGMHAPTLAVLRRQSMSFNAYMTWWASTSTLRGYT